MIAKPLLANLILSVEKDELRIAAGLQDRVAQVYQGLVYMDFERSHMEREGFGRYVEMDPALLPPLYIAYRADLSEESGVFHSDLRERFQRGAPEVLEAMAFWANLTDRVKALLLAGKGREIGPLLDANFDKRRSICRISDGNIRMVETARAAGASAKFSGSGGAIVGTYEDERMFRRLEEELARLKIKVIQPAISPAAGEARA